LEAKVKSVHLFCYYYSIMYFDLKLNKRTNLELQALKVLLHSEMWKRKQWKRLNFCGSGSTLKKEAGSGSELESFLRIFEDPETF